MAIPEIIAYQEELVGLLGQYFEGSMPIAAEWRTEFGAGMYSPRVDVAVGPFATIHGEQLIAEYDHLLTRSSRLIIALVEFHLHNTGEETDPGYLLKQLHHVNRNARCFLAIEIENTGSRKHLMGDAVNAAALGRIGIAVGWTPTMFRAFLNLKRYFEYLGSVGKNTFNLGNLLIVDKYQLLESISRA